jgi:hypothetical protein
LNGQINTKRSVENRDGKFAWIDLEDLKNYDGKFAWIDLEDLKNYDGKFAWIDLEDLALSSIIKNNRR